MATPAANVALKALGPITIYFKPTDETTPAAQYYDPDNSLIPRPFKSGDPLGRSLGEVENGYLGIYYVINSSLGPFWSKAYLKLDDQGKTWGPSDGVTGRADPEPPLTDEYLPYLPPVVKLPGNFGTFQNVASKQPAQAVADTTGKKPTDTTNGPGSGGKSTDIWAWIKARPYVPGVALASLLLLFFIARISRSS